MITLLGVEVRRLFARRVVRILFLLCVLGIVVAGVTVFLQSSRKSVAEVVANDPFVQEELRRCQRGEFGPVVPGDSTEPTTRPTTEQCMEFIGVNDPSFRLSELEAILIGSSVPLILLAWVIGATAIGAEWQRGTLQTMLTWEPRRLRLIGIKMLACGIVVAVGFLLLQLLLSLALWPAAAFRGSTAGTDTEWWLTLAGVLARGSATAVFAAVVGFAIAMIGRNTAAALGVGFLYISVIEGLVRGLRPQYIPWLVADNAALFITADPEALPIVERTTAESGLLLLVYVAVLGIAAAAFFKARDVT